MPPTKVISTIFFSQWQCKPFVCEDTIASICMYKSAKIFTYEEVDGRNHGAGQLRELSCRLLIEGIKCDCFKQYLINIAVSRDKSPTDEKYKQ